MGEVPVVEGKCKAVLHVLFLRASGCIHGDCRFIPHPHNAENMAWHMQRVTNARHKFAIAGRAYQGLFRFVIIPIVNTIVVRPGMVGLFCQNFADHQLSTVAAIPHTGQSQQ